MVHLSTNRAAGTRFYVLGVKRGEGRVEEGLIEW